MTPMPRQLRRPRGFTLLELILALVISAIVSLAVVTLLFAALADDRYLRTAHSSQAEVELAVRRIANNIREAQTGSIVVGTGALTTKTQPDATNGYPNGVTISYALQTDPANTGRKQLVETDPRYGTSNVLANNVSTFTIAAVSGIDGLYAVDLVIASNPASERHIRVYARN